MIRHIAPGFIVGLLFGAGVALSGMVDPGRVLGFLDVAGKWDPTLGFVLASALAPSWTAYALRNRMDRPLLAKDFSIPENRTIETRLIAGAAMFGIGWGLIGLCPGPAVAGLILGRWEVWLFVGAMLAGMWLQRVHADVRNRGSVRLLGEVG